MPTGGPAVIVLPLSLLSEMWGWEKQSGFSPPLSDPHKTHPTPLTESSSLSWGGLSLCTQGASPGFVPPLLQAGDTGRERWDSQVVW